MLFFRRFSRLVAQQPPNPLPVLSLERSLLCHACSSIFHGRGGEGCPMCFSRDTIPLSSAIRYSPGKVIKMQRYIAKRDQKKALEAAKVKKQGEKNIALFLTDCRGSSTHN